MTTPTIQNAMTVDVEDYFQVSAFEPYISRDDWQSLPHRVEKNTHLVLDLFAQHEVKATFFTLGWVADNYPQLIHRIVAEGHELASHGYEHIRVTQQTAEDFYVDIVETKKLLEDLGGTAVTGYRAASYSIGKHNTWAFEQLQKAGYQYSSSVYPIRHDIYGWPEAQRFRFNPKNAPDLLEIPITTLEFKGKRFPCGGGGYFRLFPYSLSRYALNKVNRQDQQACIFYFHPWEIDPAQPRQQGLNAKTRFRHYLNLTRMEHRLDRLLHDFNWGRMDNIFLQQAHSVTASAATEDTDSPVALA